MFDAAPLSQLGTWAFIAYLIGATLYIAWRCAE